MRVLVTGSSSHLAQALLPLLCDHPDISRVTGVDIHPSSYQHPKFTATQADLTSTDIPMLLQQQDALVHLAFVVLRGKTPVDVMRAINITTSQQLFDSAVKSGMQHIVHLSSASVYGDGIWINEDAPLHPIKDFLYAEHKTELEDWLIEKHPQICRLRPHIILGKYAQPLLINLLRQPFYVKLPDPQPVLQCVHEADVALAIIAALLKKARGAYNLAANPCFSFRDTIIKRNRLAIPLPPKLAKSALNLIWHSTGIGGEIGWIDGANKSLTLDCSKAENELNWEPTIHTHKMLFE